MVIVAFSKLIASCASPGKALHVVPIDWLTTLGGIAELIRAACLGPFQAGDTLQCW